MDLNKDLMWVEEQIDELLDEKRMMGFQEHEPVAEIDVLIESLEVQQAELVEKIKSHQRGA